MKRSTVTLALSLFAITVSSVRAEKIEVEIKFVIQPENHAAALQKLAALKKEKSKNVTISFFETAKPSLGEVILRARKQPGESDDSTVKVRSVGASSKPGPIEQTLKEEQDWTNPAAPNLSRSCDWKSVPEDLFDEVTAGRAKPEALFKGAGQTELIAERLPKFDGSELRCYGPFETEKTRYKFTDEFPEITLESWHLEKKNEKKEVLELSIKIKAGDQAAVKKTAAAFFKAVEDAGFGKPLTTSKTRIVLDFYQSGK